MDWEPNHIGHQSRVPALPLVPLGKWPTWPRPSKWQKWVLQAIIYIWNYISWQFSHLYLCHLITYSYMQYSEMLYGLFSLQTNSCISLHYQSDILWHNGTNYKQLPFSSDIWAGTSAMGICAFFYMWHCFSVVVFQICIVTWGDICHGYMSILLYVKLIWCIGVPEMYGWLPGANDIVTTRERAHMWNSSGLYSVISVFLDMRFHISQYEIEVMQCSGVPVIYAWLMGGPFALGICASYISNLSCVVVLHRTMVDWWGVHLPWVYVYPAISETYAV